MNMKGVKKKHLTPLTFCCMIARVMKMNEILAQALLYDFYGELLTKHQRDIYEQFVLEDLSLSEIAIHAGISRQGVHDLVKRCQKLLEGYEEKLHLVERFLTVRERVKEINQVLDAYDTYAKEDNKKDVKTREMLVEIRRISEQIIEEL